MPDRCTPGSNRQSRHVSPVHGLERKVGKTWYVDWRCSTCQHTWTTDGGTGFFPDYKKEK